MSSDIYQYETNRRSPKPSPIISCYRVKVSNESNKPLQGDRKHEHYQMILHETKKKLHHPQGIECQSFQLFSKFKK